MRLGQLRASDRARLAELLVATGAFHGDEVEVALSLFDLSHASSVHQDRGAKDASVDYEFIGAFAQHGGSEQLIGYASFGPTPSTDGTYDLYWLAVDPAAQGQGAGRALVSAVERLLAERGARLLVVETSSRDDYAAARGFYLATGYQEAARVRDFYAPADDRIIMTAPLTTRERGVATR